MSDAIKQAIEALDDQDKMLADFAFGSFDPRRSKVIEAIKALQALQGEAAPQPAVPDRYAGVKIWVGEKQVTQMVSKALIENEVAEGISIAEAARRCLNLLSAAKEEES